MTCGAISPAEAPLASRAAINIVALVAAPQRIPVRANRKGPSSRSLRLPNRSPSRPESDQDTSTGVRRSVRLPPKRYLGELERDLVRCRERGYALNLGEHLAEVRAIGVPVRGARDRPVAAITVAGPSSRLEREQLVALLPRLRETADSITVDAREA